MGAFFFEMKNGHKSQVKTIGSNIGFDLRLVDLRLVTVFKKIGGWYG